MFCASDIHLYCRLLIADICVYTRRVSALACACMCMFVIVLLVMFFDASPHVLLIY